MMDFLYSKIYSAIKDRLAERSMSLYQKYTTRANLLFGSSIQKKGTGRYIAHFIALLLMCSDTRKEGIVKKNKKLPYLLGIIFH